MRMSKGHLLMAPVFSGATGFDVESEDRGCGSSCSETLNGAKKLTANTYQEPMALAA